MNQIKLEPMYKIQDSSTGLWSNGGTSPYFTKRGKVWTSRGALLNHLVQFLERRYVAYNQNEYVYKYINTLRDEWLVFDITNPLLIGIKATEFVKAAPSYDKWMARQSLNSVNNV